MATFFEILNLPKNVIAGFQHRFVLVARLATGAIDGAYVGTVSFTSTDPAAGLPANYTFTGAEGGVQDFRAIFDTSGAQKLFVTDGTINGSANFTVEPQPPGWGFDDFGRLPYGDAVAGIGAYIARAVAISTREVDVTVSELVQDDSAFLTGDALNPKTWTVQRLDSAAFFTVAQVTQISQFTYRVLVLEEFGSVDITHQISSNTLLDASGNLIKSPRQANFLGLLDENEATPTTALAKKKVLAQDLANPPTAAFFVGGTLKINAAGDYANVAGIELTRKLLLRRYYSSPGDFFHLPNYGVGLRVKVPVHATDLANLQQQVQKQSLAEREVVQAKASLSLSTQGVLVVQVKAKTNTGDDVPVAMGVNQTGALVVL